MTDHYIYLIRTREFADQNEPTYKIGKTTQPPNSRMQGYPMGSEIFQFTKVYDCHILEKKIITKFHKLFVHRKQFGKETFTGNVNAMRRVINREIDEDEMERENNAINTIIRENIAKKILQQQINKTKTPDLLEGTSIIHITDETDEDSIENSDSMESQDSYECKTNNVPIKDNNISKSARNPEKKTLKTFCRYLYETRPSWYVENTYVDIDFIESAYRLYFSDRHTNKPVIAKRLKNFLYDKSRRTKGVTEKRLLSFSALKMVY